MSWLWIVLGVLVGLPLVAAGVGSLLPRDHVARMRLELSSTPERVWALVSDVGGTARWRSDVRRLEIQPNPGGPPRYAETTKQGTVVFEVVKQEPPRRQVVRVVDEGQPFGGTWTWELDPAGTGTRLTITEAGFIKNPLFRLMGKLFFSPTASMDTYLRALAKELGESTAPQQVAGP